jgi:adenosylcobinamide amidohydrolase
MMDLFQTDCAQPWLVARFSRPWRVLSWSMNRPGFTTATRVAWLEVRDAELPVDVDPLALLQSRLAAADLADAVAMMTARDIRRHRGAQAYDAPVATQVLATLGLTNGVAFDPTGNVRPAQAVARTGTINILAALSAPLAEPAMLEAMSIAATARSAALLSDAGRIAATGTDCIVVACPDEAPGATYAGLHTAAGRALAQAVYMATREARADWEAEFAT